MLNLESPWTVGDRDTWRGIPFIPIRNAAGDDVCAIFGRYSLLSDSFIIGDEELERARLIAAAPELLSAQTIGSVDTAEVMEFAADRLVDKCGDDAGVDFVQSLRRRAQIGRDAMQKATGRAE